MARMGSRPSVVLSEDSQRTSGRDAQEMNITAAKAVASAVRTSLGPQGMDKMLVDSSGNVVITNDGVTILDEMDIDHPAAEMIIEVADIQEEEVGDGTTSAVIVAGELLRRAEELLDNRIHPTTIVKGYRDAAREATQALADGAISVDASDTDELERIAATALTGKGADQAKDHLTSLVVSSVAQVTEDGEVARDEIELERALGAPVEQSEVFEGMIIDKNPVHEDMPHRVEDARIAILGDELDVEDIETDVEINIEDPDMLDEIRESEEKEIRDFVERLDDLGVKAVFASNSIADIAQNMFARLGIVAVRHTGDSDLERLARATGGTVVTNYDQLDEDDLGEAGAVSYDDLGDDQVFYFEEPAEANVATFILRGGTEHVVDELERAIEDSLDVVTQAVEHGEVLPGGAAPEMLVSLHLRDHAESIGGREQLAVEAFADAVEVVPRTLAENAGHDPIDSIVELRAAHDGGDTTAGLDAETGNVIDMTEEGVLEPLQVKSQALESATEAASMILRIDDVISAGDLSTGGDDDDEGGAPGGAPGGMGGMGGGMGGMM